jgi:hypothetical protein
MDVFVSSVVRGFEEARDAAVEGIELLGHSAVRSERFVAQPDAPQVVCLREARDADAVVLLLGATYGPLQTSGCSASHEEYLSVRESDKVLVFIEEGVDPEPAQAAFIKDVRAWTSPGHLTSPFRNTQELTRAVVRSLKDFEVRRSGGLIDDGEMLKRAEQNVRRHRNHGSGDLIVTIVPGPTQTLVRPSELEPSSLGRSLAQEALFGPDPLFGLEGAREPRLLDGELVLEHAAGWVSLAATGDVTIRRACRPPDGLRPIVESLVEAAIASSLRFGARVLAQIDSVERAPYAVVVATITNPNSWVTAAEFQANPNRLTMSRFLDMTPVSAYLSPPGRRRPQLTADAEGVAADLTVLLRNTIKGGGTRWQ